MSKKVIWSKIDLKRAIKDVTEGKGVRASARYHDKFVGIVFNILFIYVLFQLYFNIFRVPNLNTVSIYTYIYIYSSVSMYKKTNTISYNNSTYPL